MAKFLVVFSLFLLYDLSQMAQKPLPIGISDFKTVIEEGYAYVDKTLFIEELLEKGTAVALIPRLRRFGKTLNLSMVRYFFEKTDQPTDYLFKDLKIWKNEKCRSLQGQFPVIFISLKDVKLASWQETLASFKALIAAEFQRHSYLLDGEVLSDAEKEDFYKILHKEDGQILIQNSLFLLSKWLHRYHNIPAFLLIDEYDTPAHAAFFHGYYDIFILFMRNWLSAGLKDNMYLAKGVLTGILRIAKESVFSGLNNVSTFSILNSTFQDKFGLLESEVKSLLEERGLGESLPMMRKWYNGYRIGSCEGIYNPWSVLKCIEENGELAPYWANTSDNALMKQLITKGSKEIKSDVEVLINGGIIEKEIEEGIVFSGLEQDPKAIWTLLLFSGYLTLAETPASMKPYLLRIPNSEIEKIYTSMIVEWFEKSIHLSEYQDLLNSLITGDIETFSLIFQEFLVSATSTFDVSAEEPEIMYHAFVLGMLLGLKERYEVKSNRESGFGRYDVMLIPKNKDDLAIIMEFKKISRFEKTDLETAVAQALKQIVDKGYDQELKDRGIHRILHLGLAFQGKKVLIRGQ